MENWAYSSYLGGAGADAATAVAADAAGAVYVTGRTMSADFPNQGGAFSDLKGRGDAFVTKIGSAGIIAWSTYLGGTETSGNESGYGIAVDNLKGAVYVTGVVESADFPIRHPLYRWDTLGDAFVTGFDLSGRLVFSTYLGGNHQDRGSALGLDQQGNVYVTGYTISTDFPKKNPLYNLRPLDPQDGFVTKIVPYSPSPAMQLLLLILENLPE